MDPFNLVQEKYSHPLGGYSAQELGLDLPQVNRLYIDGTCGGDDFHRDNATVGLYNGHTHMCPFEDRYKSICIIEKYLRNSDGTMSNMLIHEYAHVLQEPLVKFIGHGPVRNSHVIKKVGWRGRLKDAHQSDWNDEQHGKSFLVALQKLGRPDLWSPLVEVPH